MNPFATEPAPHRRFSASSLLRLLGAGLLAILLAASAYLSFAQKQSAVPGLIVHEWGTFTSITGNDGGAIEWLSFSPVTDLPGFVERTSVADLKSGLRGTLRMETPVIYFYSPREATVSVKVSFEKGLITEWYPHASRVEPAAPPANVAFSQMRSNGTISWDSVTLTPNLAANFPREDRGSHYYAARETDAVPLRIDSSSGKQQEKFLFYRGVASLSPPVSARVSPDGKIELRNLGAQPIPALILFERRGDKLGYRILNVPQDRAVLDAPALTGSLDSLRGEIENILVAQGLYRPEAHAMVETWRDSWFEEGSRLFYIVPRPFVDSILPLSIKLAQSPSQAGEGSAPAQTVRVFVGRFELVTPATEKSVKAALAARDAGTLRKYGRFFEPIFEIIIAKESDPANVSRLRRDQAAFYNSPLAQTR
jgi:hypothetical protein